MKIILALTILISFAFYDIKEISAKNNNNNKNPNIVINGFADMIFNDVVAGDQVDIARHFNVTVENINNSHNKQSISCSLEDNILIFNELGGDDYFQLDATIEEDSQCSIVRITGIIPANINGGKKYKAQGKINISYSDD